tara:strand:- start:34 stop:222 length:189 start_codon:yes stop_codon:yes gene_type:complete
MSEKEILRCTNCGCTIENPSSFCDGKTCDTCELAYKVENLIGDLCGIKEHIQELEMRKKNHE